MTIEDIKELIRIVHETGIAELEVQRGDNRVRIRSTIAAANHEVMMHQANPTGAFTTTTPSFNPTAASPLPSPGSSAGEDETNVVVKSPIVGTYYDSPSPGS